MILRKEDYNNLEYDNDREVFIANCDVTKEEKERLLNLDKFFVAVYHKHMIYNYKDLLV